MSEKIEISLFDLVLSLSTAIDFVSKEMVNHQKRVAYIAFRIAKEMGLSKQEQRDIIMASALHDIGGITLKERINTLQFEIEMPHEHARLGYYLLQKFKPFSNIAVLVKYHHVRWNYGNVVEFPNEEIPIGSYIMHVADRVEIAINRKEDVLQQVEKICEIIEEKKGDKFHPDVVDAFMNLSKKEYFWFEMESNRMEYMIKDKIQFPIEKLDMKGFFDLAKMFSQFIDFRSRFTATHSSGVASTAQMLAKRLGMSYTECEWIKIAGYLHDLGKVAIPTEILDKNGKLTAEEFGIIKRHSFYTYYILDPIRSLDKIKEWASFHHERLDGKGYPFHLKAEDIPLGARIIAVADIFTAITEDRPYRSGMGKNKVIEILNEMTANGALDEQVTTQLIKHYDEINQIRDCIQKQALEEYEEFFASQAAV